MIAVISLGSVRLVYLKNSPGVLFLDDTAGARWIRYDLEFSLRARPAERLTTGFRHTFRLDQPVEGARITVRAMKHCTVVLDGKTIFTHPYELDRWKQHHHIKVPFTINPGTHTILLVITNESSHPAVIAHSEALPIRTGPEWFASMDGNNWKPALPASIVRLPKVSTQFPAAKDGLVAILPYLAIIFFVAVFLSLKSDSQSKIISNLGRWRPDPSQFRFVLLALWLLLSLNNMFKLGPHVGYDVRHHIKYIEFIITEASLPLATDGWQMFQAPLYYIVSAPLYGLLMQRFDFATIAKILLLIPILCGLLQIEIVYRASRLVFRQRKDLQCIAILMGALLPMHIYICQGVGNEPLAGCFISLVILYCLKLIVPYQQKQTPRFFILLGLFWGLALLSKVSAVLLWPVLIVAIFAHTRMVTGPFKYLMSSLLFVFGISILTAGWYYFRNYMELGSFFIGGWDPSRGIVWWQDPGFRTWPQLLSFGQSLKYPIYSGVSGFWDAVYSTLWLDGFNSSVTTFVNRPPWNFNFMTAGALLSLVPTVFILSSFRSVLRAENPFRNAVIFSVGTISLFLIAMLDLYLQLPIYGAAKSTYTLGLLPCYAILTAAGAEYFLGHRIIRSVAIASFSCWAFAAYAAFFVISAQH